MQGYFEQVLDLGADCAVHLDTWARRRIHRLQLFEMAPRGRAARSISALDCLQNHRTPNSHAFPSIPKPSLCKPYTSQNVSNCPRTLFYQFTLVPLYSGFAKWMSADWMERAEPLSTLLLFGSVSTSYPAWAFLSGPSFGYTPSALADIGFVVSYAIVAIEIVGTTALWGPTWLRWLGLLATALLALIHSNIAQGVYPYIIICSFCLWLPAKRSKSILQALHTLNTVSTTSTASTPSTSSASHLVPPEAVKQAAKNNSKVKKSIKSPSIAERLSTFFSRQLPLFILCAFLLFQAIAPAVPYFSKHDPSWASHANSLSWRMMLLTQDTLVQWHSFTYEHPLTNPPQLASAIVLHHSEDEAWTSKAVNADTWLSIRNSAALLYQWSVRRVMPEIVKKYGSDMIPLSAYRSINGRPYQPWIRLDRSDVKTSRCSRWFGCDELLEPQIEEYNTMDWLVRKQIWTDEWIAKGFESVYFAQRSGGMEFAFNFKRFSKRLHLVLLAGEVQVISALGETSKPLRGEQLPIDFEVYHEVRTTSTEPAAWAFIWPWPRNMTLADALSQ